MDSWLRRFCKKHLRSQGIDPLASRATRAWYIHDHAENNLVAIVYGGVDCDGSRWDNCVEILPAVPMLIERWIDRYMADREGPQWWRICCPSDAPDRSDHRDLALEAHEDGHDHVLYC